MTDHTPGILSGQSIVYFGPTPWNDLWRNRHQLMSRFAKQNLVLYVEPPALTLARLRELFRNHRAESRAADWRGGLEQVAPRLFVLHSPMWLPLLGKHPLNWIKYWCWHVILRRAAQGIGIKQPIIWLSHPLWIDVLGVLNEKLSLYHVVDEYAGYGGQTATDLRRLARDEVQMLEATDLTLVVSRALLKSKNQHADRVHLVPNAVDYEAFRTKDGGNDSTPYDVLGIDRPIIGYSGLIGNRLDLALIYDLAHRHPEWSFIMLGTTRRQHCEETLTALESLANVYFLGKKPVEEVPAYVHAFDVCIVPYRSDERANHSSPLKLYEYAAAAKPIITTTFAAAQEFSDFVLVADDAKTFEQHLQEALSWPRQHPRLLKGVEIAQQNTWNDRLLRISDIISKALDESRKQ